MSANDFDFQPGRVIWGGGDFSEGVAAGSIFTAQELSRKRMKRAGIARTDTL